MERLLHVIKKNRLKISRILIVCLILIDFLSTPRWPMKPLTIILLEVLAFALVLIAAFGRLWMAKGFEGSR